MRTTLLCILPSLLLLSQGAQATDRIELRYGAIAARSFGHSTYTLRASYYDDDDILTSVMSELEFPVDAYLAGAQFSADRWRDGRQRWAIAYRVYASISDPGALMMDHDWIKTPDVPYRKFSYTESDVKMSGTIMDLEFSYWLFRWFGVDLAVHGAYRYQLVKQDIVGYDGWQLRDNGDSVTISGTARGIFYKISYNLPMLGVRSTYYSGDNLRFDLKLAYVQVFATDFDDHLLRNKIGVADVTGFGGSLQTNLRLYLSRSAPGRPYIAISGDLLYVDATGDQTQSWYGDDPASPDEDDTGSIVRGIPHDVESLQVQAAIEFGLSF